MFKNRYFQIVSLLVFAFILVAFILVLKPSESFSLNRLTKPNINLGKVSEYIVQNNAVLQEKHEIQFGFLGNLYLNKIRNNQITIENEIINSVELEFLVNSNNRIKTLNVIVVQPFWNDESELLFPDNASKLFESGKYYNLSFANFTKELTDEEKTEYCISGQNYKASSLGQCIAQVSFLDNQSNEKIEVFMNNDQSSLTVEGLWMFRAVDQSQIDLSKSIENNND